MADVCEEYTDCKYCSVSLRQVRAIVLKFLFYIRVRGSVSYCLRQKYDSYFLHCHCPCECTAINGPICVGDTVITLSRLNVEISSAFHVVILTSRGVSDKLACKLEAVISFIEKA